MKKIISLCMATAMFLGVTGTAIKPIKGVADMDENNTLVIAVDEELGDLDIFTQTEYSSGTDYVYRMAYDRLLEFDAQGNLCYSLATGMYILPDDGGDGSVDNPLPDETLRQGSAILDDYTLPAEWPEGEVPGWKSSPGNILTNVDDLRFFQLGGDGIDLVINLREGIMGADGEFFDAYDFREFIEYVMLHTSRDSLVFKQWNAIANYDFDSTISSVDVSILNNYSVALKLQLNVVQLSITDFIYSLASPIAAIIPLDYYGIPAQYVHGSAMGAYKFMDNDGADNNEVTLQRNQDWWKQTYTGERYIRLQYDADINFQGLSNGNVDMLICDSKDYYDYIDDEGQIQGCSVYKAEGNPIMLTFNPESVIGSNIKVRMALSILLAQENDNKFGLNEDASLETDPYGGVLSYEAHGLWSLDEHIINPDFAYDLLEDSGYFDVDGSGHIIDLNVMIPEDNNVYYEYLINCMNQILLGTGVVLQIYNQSSSTMGQQYDFILSEINVCDINSVYNTCYGKFDDDLDELIEEAILAANHDTYTTVNAQIQGDIYRKLYMINLGWKNKMFLLKNGVSGFALPGNGFNTTGDISRIDFRWVSKTSSNG